jgi:hypothetical protein
VQYEILPFKLTKNAFKTRVLLLGRGDKENKFETTRSRIK